MELDPKKLLTKEQFQVIARRPFIEKPNEEMLIGYVSYRICNDTGLRHELSKTFNSPNPDAPIRTPNPDFEQMLGLVTDIFKNQSNRKAGSTEDTGLKPLYDLQDLLHKINPDETTDTRPSKEDAVRAKELDPRLFIGTNWTLAYLASLTILGD